jgi:hypothetical protein
LGDDEMNKDILKYHIRSIIRCLNEDIDERCLDTVQREIDILDRNLTIGRVYKIKKLKDDGRSKDSYLEVEGVLEKKYEHHYLFRNYKGIRECFLKKDFAIGEYEIKEVVK